MKSHKNSRRTSYMNKKNALNKNLWYHVWFLFLKKQNVSSYVFLHRKLELSEKCRLTGFEKSKFNVSFTECGTQNLESDSFPHFGCWAHVPLYEMK